MPPDDNQGSQSKALPSNNGRISIVSMVSVDLEEF